MNNTSGVLVFCLSLLLTGFMPNAVAQDATEEVVTDTNLSSGIVPESITEDSQIAIYKTLRLSAAQSQAVPFRVCFTGSLSNLNLSLNIRAPGAFAMNLTLTNGCHDSSSLAAVGKVQNIEYSPLKTLPKIPTSRTMW